MPTLSIHLPEQTFEKLKSAKKTGETVSAFGRSLIERQLSQMPPGVALGSMRGMLTTSPDLDPSESVIPADEFDAPDHR